MCSRDQQKPIENWWHALGNTSNIFNFNSILQHRNLLRLDFHMLFQFSVSIVALRFSFFQFLRFRLEKENRVGKRVPRNISDMISRRTFTRGTTIRCFLGVVDGGIFINIYDFNIETVIRTFESSDLVFLYFSRWNQWKVAWHVREVVKNASAKEKITILCILSSSKRKPKKLNSPINFLQPVSKMRRDYAR